MVDFEKEYEKIVQNRGSQTYETPEKQGEQIKKCSILKDVNIQYGKLQYHKNQITYNA
ncbi:MAG: hypothetical protein IJV12_06700 [Acidaminococcaceae bacterium]|nr:hypothetical protein [Acidaminococcaceae bacterium]